MGLVSRWVHRVNSEGKTKDGIWSFYSTYFRDPLVSNENHKKISAFTAHWVIRR